MTHIPLEHLRARVRKTRGPQFLLPARFSDATFENFEPDPAYPSQEEAVAAISALVHAPAPSRWPWRRRVDAGPRGIYLDGPPGIGKTHLLAAAFHVAPEPKLFATFDEFSAAAGTLGMRKLARLLADQRVVCVDEIDLRDPGNIMLLTSLVRAMLHGRPRILATANADPTVMGGQDLGEAFRRELGEIASAFAVVSVDGIDRRTVYPGDRDGDPSPLEGIRTLTIEWSALREFLRETHPMYDAAWLQELDLIAVDRLDPLQDTDQALRFVRFIDRVYDRAVRLQVNVTQIPLADLLAPIRDDRRFQLHYARCFSRLTELIAGSAEKLGRGQAP